VIDVGPLPCRPCDQRVCEPGDFRCLRNIAPETVVMPPPSCSKGRETTRSSNLVLVGFLLITASLGIVQFSLFAAQSVFLVAAAPLDHRGIARRTPPGGAGVLPAVARLCRPGR
jgi:hypothetical protein